MKSNQKRDKIPPFEGYTWLPRSTMKMPLTKQWTAFLTIKQENIYYKLIRRLFRTSIRHDLSSKGNFVFLTFGPWKFLSPNVLALDHRIVEVCIHLLQSVKLLSDLCLRYIAVKFNVSSSYRVRRIYSTLNYYIIFIVVPTSELKN